MWSPGLFSLPVVFRGPKGGGGRPKRALPWRQGFATEEVASQFLIESR